MPRLKGESKNFEDRTQPWTKILQQRFNEFLMKTGVALKGDPAAELGLLPPVIKPLHPDSEGYTRAWSNVEWTPEEAEMLDKGATPRDLLLYRAYRNIPSQVGK